jgi:hypothetical protein
LRPEASGGALLPASHTALRDPNQKAEGESGERNREQTLDRHSLNSLRDPGTELRSTNHADRKSNRPMEARAAREATGHD